MTTNGLSLGYLTDAEVKAVVESTSGLRIAIYDKQYRDESKVAHAFVPNGYVCLIPDGALGGTWYGTTPEEADLRGASSAEVSIVNTGVAITRILQEHPVTSTPSRLKSSCLLRAYGRGGCAQRRGDDRV